MRSPTTPQRRAPGSSVVLGFPVSVRPGFFGLVVVAVLTNPGAFGFWLAGSLAVLTLTHELGHAAAARAFGARAEISLDLLAGYTSYMPTRPMTTGERVATILAGPAAEIGPALVALALMGANPLSYESVTDTDARWAVWLAGPVLGLFNLIPLLPLDGGMVVSTVLERYSPKRGRRIALGFSIAITSVAMVALALQPRLRLTALFALALLVVQVLQLASELRAGRPSVWRNPGRAIVEQLLDSGETAQAAELGARLFQEERSADVAVLMARCAARLGEISTAEAWLQAARYATDDPGIVVDELEQHVDLAPVRSAPAAAVLRRALVGD